MTAPRPDEAARMAQHFEAHNAAQMRQDRTEAWLAALRPLFWLVVALGVSLALLHACTVAVALVADPLAGVPW
jgi:Na+/H+ antiporter NhaB